MVQNFFHRAGNSSPSDASFILKVIAIIRSASDYKDLS